MIQPQQTLEDKDFKTNKFLEGPYQKGLDEGRATRESYNDGILACPYSDSVNRNLWLTGFETGYFIQTSR